MKFISQSHITSHSGANFLRRHHFQHTTFAGALVSILLLTVVSCSALGGGAYTSLSVMQAKRMLDSNATIVVLDVRTPEEFTSETGHLNNALLIPVQELEGRMSELAPYRKQTILVYCRSGARSKRASDLLIQQGFTLINMDGGITAWNQANLPVVR